MTRDRHPLTSRLPTKIKKYREKECFYNLPNVWHSFLLLLISKFFYPKESFFYFRLVTAINISLSSSFEALTSLGSAKELAECLDLRVGMYEILSPPPWTESLDRLLDERFALQPRREVFPSSTVSSLKKRRYIQRFYMRASCSTRVRSWERAGAKNASHTVRISNVGPYICVQ